MAAESAAAAAWGAVSHAETAGLPALVSHAAHQVRKQSASGASEPLPRTHTASPGCQKALPALELFQWTIVNAPYFQLRKESKAVRSVPAGCQGGRGEALWPLQPWTPGPVVFVRSSLPAGLYYASVPGSRLSTPLRGPVSFPCRLLHRWAQQRAGVDLPWRTKIGSGFAIIHGWGLVISHLAMVGSNVTVFHGVTIGQKADISADGRIRSYPTIEDEVWIGTHAVIVGGVSVGRGSRIAPGTIVTDDVEPYSIVGGNPMRVIKAGALPDIVNPADLQS
jgi:serine O-acetyltransferase